MRPYLPYNILLALTVLFCGLCVLYQFVLREETATTLQYHYPAVSAESDAPVQEAQPPGRIPIEGEQAAPTVQAPDAITEVSFPLELNGATVEQLIFIPQVGDVTAQRIVQYREVLGGYTELEQLLEIRGIGQGTFEHLYAYLYIEPALAGEGGSDG